MKQFEGMFYDYKKGKKQKSVRKVCIFKNEAGYLCKKVNAPMEYKFKTVWYSFCER